MTLSSYLKQFHSLRKILILGSGAVGKTTLLKVLKIGKSLNQLGNGELNYHRTPFLELDTLSARGLIKDEVQGTFQIYDVAGQFDQPFHPLKDISHSVLGHVDLIILVYAMNNVQSLLDLVMWVKLVNEFKNGSSLDSEPEYILIQNKTDMEGSIDPSLVDMMMQSDTPQIKAHFQVSCMNGTGIDELKSWIVNKYFKN